MEKIIRDDNKVSMTLKVNAKGEVYGEYTCKAETPEELSMLLNECKSLYLMHTQ